ncbi:hypothetical protein [Neptunitalea lumnitzerae]|uniref:Uncharacterized protein n=1 Tax=Neptunitalea lumnitzerae TaxID=2965509 RepID=A0ABQ5MEL1_9FLAO|nr:hypothetical protein [Neptunitalea sp. Y10]GLB47836.1 hypothetical protein Y10_02040 [Neptunitalea sp. Y10]
MKNNTFTYKKISIVVMLLVTMFTATIGNAQKKRSGTWKLEQSEALSDSITIRGAVFAKGILGWRVVNESVMVQVFSGKFMIASDLFVDEQGTFSIRFAKKDIVTETLRVTFNADHFALVEIPELLPKETAIEVYTEKTSYRDSRGKPDIYYNY